MNNNVLVTGGNGFLGLHIIAQLLQQNYHVTTTLRNLSKKQDVIDTLTNNEIDNLDQLDFVEADLAQDKGWQGAMTNIDYVLSVASPLFDSNASNLDQVFNNAKDGVLRILKAAYNAQVKRVVMTANFGAVGFSNLDRNSITTEDDWTNPDQPGLSPYEKSKLLAEKAAWDFINQSDGHMEFATVNPVAILGAPLNDHISGSFEIVKNIVDGSMTRIPNIELNVVDVRDVATIHIKTMITPAANGQRFIASEDGKISMKEIASLVRAKRPQLASKITTKSMPDWILSVGAPFNSEAKEGKLLHDMSRNVSNDKAKKILGWQPISNNEDTVLATVDTIAKQMK